MAKKITRYAIAAIIVFVSLHFVYQQASSMVATRRAEQATLVRHQLTLITNRTYYTDTSLIAALQVNNIYGHPMEAEVTISLSDGVVSLSDGVVSSLGDYDISQNNAAPGIFRFQTDYDGNAAINIPLYGTHVGWHLMYITVDSSLGVEHFEKDILLSYRYGQNLIIHFDKGLYKPGDDVLFRILAVNRDTATPFGGAVYTVSIFDGNDNRVMREDKQTSDFGIMSGRFRLADEVNSGFYRLVVERDGAFAAQATFEVSPYVLPKFEVILEANHQQFGVGDEISITGHVRYFFGEPVTQGAVTVYVNGGAMLVGDLDENGEFLLNFYASQIGAYSIVAEVIDNSNYRVEASLTVRVAEGPFEVELLPQHGYLVQGMPNRVYIFTNRADGTPVRAHLQISGRNFSRQVATDDNGMGVFVLEDALGANHISVRGQDMDGNDIGRDFEFPGISRAVALSTCKPRYAMGEAINLTLHSLERDGSFVIYAYRNNRLLAMTSTDYDQYQLYLGDIYGLIDIYAIWIPRGDTRNREAFSHARKTVFIDPGSFMQLTVESDRHEYLPGEFVNLNIGVTDDTGNPLTAALLVSMVDEAMLALAANDLSICNIRLALEDIRFSDGLCAATLYASLIAGASEQAITRIMLRQGETAPGIRTAWLTNEPPHQGSVGHMTGSVNRWAGNVFRVQFLVLMVSVFFLLRHDKKPGIYSAGVYHDTPGYVSDHASGHAPDQILSYPPGHTPSQTSSYPPDHVPGHIPGIYPDIPGYLPNRPLDDDSGKSPSLKRDRIATLAVVAAIALFIFALIFLSSCGSGDFASSDEAAEAPPPAAEEMWAAEDTWADTDDAPAHEPEPPRPPEPPTVPDAADIPDREIDLEDRFEQDLDEAEADVDADPAGRPIEEIETQTARVRRLFLETMLFLPEVIAHDGQADLSFMLADNITTWNIQVVGNTMDGLVGHTESSIRAFQPFFVDFSLPMNSIRHDQVSIPVTVFNYTEDEQTVVLTIADFDWFTLHVDPVQTMVVPSGQTQMIYVPITINHFGNFVFRVYADTHDFADASERSIRVNPEGFRIERVVSSGSIERSIQQQLIFFNEDIPDTRRATIKFYPSAMAQVIEGMENIFRMPFGCFEQTSSILFPNILALRYMQDNGIDNPQLTQRALEFISSGYQRLLTFEVRGTPGGFSLFGHAPAETLLTAYGLMQLQNLSGVYTIDERVMERMAEFVFDHQNPDGSFEITGPGMSHIRDSDRFAFSAYITWAISEAFPNDPRLRAAVDYLVSRLDSTDDNFTLALIANVLVNTGSPYASGVLERLNKNATRDGDTTYLTTNIVDYFGTRGHAQNLQTTALASMAFSRSSSHDATNALFNNFIIANRDSWGTWHSTQATILSLMAVTNYATAAPLLDGQITVTIGDQQQVIDVRANNTLDFYMLTFTGLERENVIDIHFPDIGRMTYKISLEYFAPYDSVVLDRGFEITSTMNTRLSVHEWVDQELRIINRSGEMVNNGLVAISIPQGFRVEASSLATLRNQGLIERYETRFATINLYLRDIAPGEILDLVVAYRPSFPVDVTGGHVRVFDYYNPWVEGFLMPVGIVVTP